MTKVQVTGGTGVLGQAAAKALASNQISFLLGSRSSKIKDYNNSTPATAETTKPWIQLDLTKSEETDRSIGDDVNVVVHLAGLPPQKTQGQPADIVLTYSSIVGVNKIPFSYYQAKLAVATELVEIVKRPPLNGRYDLGGKRVYNMEEIMNSLLKVRGKKKPILNLPTLGGILRAFSQGHNPGDQIATNSTTWEEYLSEQYRK